MNACGHHHVGHIGILGVDKKGQEFYQISLGGHAGHSGESASSAKLLALCLAQSCVAVIDNIINIHLSLRHQDESFLACFRRVGIQPFKASLRSDAHDTAA